MRAFKLIWVVLAACGSTKADENPPPIVVEYSQIEPAGAAVDVILDGDTGYALGISDLLVLNISDPTNITANANAGWGGNGFFVRDDKAYASHGSSQELFVRVADLESLFEPADYTVGPRAATRLVANDERAYVASQAGVLLVEFESKPPLLGSIGLPGYVDDITLFESVIATAAGAAGLVLIDIENFPPDAPIYPFKSEDGNVLAVFFLEDGVLVVASEFALTTYTVDRGAGGGESESEAESEEENEVLTPTRLGRTDIDISIAYAAGDTAYVVGKPCVGAEVFKDGATPAGFHVVDLSDRARPIETVCASLAWTGTRTSPLGARGLAVTGDLAALATDAQIRFFGVPAAPAAK